MSPATWNTLPNELKLSVVDFLPLDQVRTFADLDRNTYGLCIPRLFEVVKLENLSALRAFLNQVPRAYNQYIRHLEISTQHELGCTSMLTEVHPATDALVEFISHCNMLESFSLRIATSLAKHIIPCFAHLYNLKRLSIANCGGDSTAPISERLVVSIAASIPNLEHLHVDRIARSSLHAPDLLGAHPYIPLVSGDDDIPPHPILGSDLSLPSLLRIPTLRTLHIRDTHLGDPRWTTVPISCSSLEVLDLSGSPYVTHEFNQICTERILAKVGPSLDNCSLHTALSSAECAAPLKRLRHVQLTPLFPVDNVVQTLTTLSGSPVEQLSVQCYADDALDMCSALEDFLSLRAEKGLYENLTGINVRFGADGEVSGADEEEKMARISAAKRLQEYCADMCISGNIDGAGERLPQNIADVSFTLSGLKDDDTFTKN